MSNAVKRLSAPLAQCVKHRSSNQTLTGSNLAEYPLFIFFIIISFFSFFIRFYSSFFMESIDQYAEKSCSVLAITGRHRQMNVALPNEPRHKKTGFLPMRKQRRRSASQ